MEPTSPLLLTIEQTASLLGIGRTKTYELINRGRLNAVHIGRAMRVPRVEAERYVGELTAEARSDQLAD